MRCERERERERERVTYCAHPREYGPERFATAQLALVRY